jgi:hypothetical protein
MQIADIVILALVQGAHTNEQGRKLPMVLRALGVSATTAFIQVGPCLFALIVGEIDNAFRQVLLSKLVRDL